jgi:hypothetical protein
MPPAGLRFMARSERARKVAQPHHFSMQDRFAFLKYGAQQPPAIEKNLEGGSILNVQTAEMVCEEKVKTFFIKFLFCLYVRGITGV